MPLSPLLRYASRFPLSYFRFFDAILAIISDIATIILTFLRHFIIAISFDMPLPFHCRHYFRHAAAAISPVFVFGLRFSSFFFHFLSLSLPLAFAAVFFARFHFRFIHC
jgi:hypothetical protein